MSCCPKLMRSMNFKASAAMATAIETRKTRASVIVFMNSTVFKGFSKLDNVRDHRAGTIDLQAEKGTRKSGFVCIALLCREAGVSEFP